MRQKLQSVLRYMEDDIDNNNGGGITIDFQGLMLRLTFDVSHPSLHLG